MRLQRHVSAVRDDAKKVPTSTERGERLAKLLVRAARAAKDVVSEAAELLGEDSEDVLAHLGREVSDEACATLRALHALAVCDDKDCEDPLRSVKVDVSSLPPSIEVETIQERRERERLERQERRLEQIVAQQEKARERREAREAEERAARADQPTPVDGIVREDPEEL